MEENKTGNEFCGNCGAKKSQKYKYCPHCGVSYTTNQTNEEQNIVEIIEERPPVLKFCPSCGMEIIKEDIYCIECGHKNPVINTLNTVTQAVTYQAKPQTQTSSKGSTVLLVLSIINAITLMPIAGIIGLMLLLLMLLEEEVSLFFFIPVAYFIASIIFLVSSIKKNSRN